MRRPLSPERGAGAVALALLTATLPLARGGVGLLATGVAAAVAAASFAAASARAPSLPRPGLVLVGVLALSAFQLVPLPAWLHAASPGAVRIFEISLAPLGLYPAARPLSLDPAASARALAAAVAATSAFLAAWSLSGSRRASARLHLGLGLAGAAAAALVLGAALAGAGPLLAPRHPFANPNHLAGLLVLAGFVMLGLGLDRRGAAGAPWLLGFAAAGAVTGLSLSRGGIAAFLLGAALFAALRVRARGGDRAPSGPHALLAGGLVGAIGIVAVLALDPVLAELRTLRGGAEEAKVRLWLPALDVLRDFPVVGVGRGAFGAVFAGYQTESGAVTFTHVENEWLQAVVDLGLPGGLLLLGAFTWIWLAAVRRRDPSNAEVGLLAGTGALAAQNALDFSLELLGVGLPFAVAMGLLARGGRPVPVRRGALWAGLAGALVAAAVALGVAHAHGGGADPGRVAAATDGPAAVEAARRAIRWHPADWVLHATPGVRLGWEGRCREALPWLLRAMALGPLAPSPHLAAARCLAGHDDVAAKREYRLAIAFGAPALPEAVSTYPSLEDLLDVAPDTPDGLLALGHVLAPSRPADAARVLRRVTDEFLDPRGVLPLARVLAALGDHDAAIVQARRHASRRPSEPDGWLVAAASLVALGREDDARAEVERGLAALPGSPPLLGFLSERALAHRRWSEARRLAEEIAPRSAGEIAGKHLAVARALAGRGLVLQALERARSATAADPGASAAWLAVAGYAAQALRHEEAVAALRRAAELPGAPPDRYAGRVAELEAAATAERARALERRALHGMDPPGER